MSCTRFPEEDIGYIYSHPLCRTRFGRYQASSAVLGRPGDRDHYLMHKMQSEGLIHVVHKSRNILKVVSLRKHAHTHKPWLHLSLYVHVRGSSPAITDDASNFTPSQLSTNSCLWFSVVLDQWCNCSTKSLWMMLTSKFIARFFVRCVTCGMNYLLLLLHVSFPILCVS